MKHLIDYISESIKNFVKKIDIGDSYKEVATKVCDGLMNHLPAWPDHKDHNLSDWEKEGAGKWWWNKSDIVRYGNENAKYAGYKLKLMTMLDTKTNNINEEVLSRSIEQIFNTTIEESVFDNNIKKNLREYEYINKIYVVLKEFFKTKDFSKVPFVNGDYKITLTSKDLNKLHTKPTIEVDGFKVSLWEMVVYKSSYRQEKYNIQIILFIYKDKKYN